MRRRDEASAGFTLIEMLVSTAMTAIILTVLVSAFVVFFHNSGYTTGRDEHAAGAETLSSFLDRDLASATSKSNVAVSLTTCPNGAAVQNIFWLTWSEFQRPAGLNVPADAEPVPGTSYTAKYSLEHDDTVPTSSSACMIRRTYPGSSLVLMRRLALTGVQPPTTVGASCTVGQSFVLTVTQYKSTTQADTSPAYTYNGCLKSRTNGLP
jgi:prepilin-type N-terminal cleavage/methylation domain-containing protein